MSENIKLVVSTWFKLKLVVKPWNRFKPEPVTSDFRALSGSTCPSMQNYFLAICGWGEVCSYSYLVDHNLDVLMQILCVFIMFLIKLPFGGYTPFSGTPILGFAQWTNKKIPNAGFPLLENKQLVGGWPTPSEKYCQLGVWHSQYCIWKKSKNVPNHQPDHLQHIAYHPMSQISQCAEPRFQRGVVRCHPRWIRPSPLVRQHRFPMEMLDLLSIQVDTFHISFH